MAEDHDGQTIQTPFVVSNLLNGQSVATLQAAFPLTEADYLRLKGSPPITSAAATLLFSGVVGYAISLGPKLEPLLFGGKMELTAGEIRTLLLGAAASALLYGVGFLWPNDKRRMLKRIELHFKKSKPSTHIVGGKT